MAVSTLGLPDCYAVDFLPLYQVQILVDNYDIGKVNAINLKAATSAALLLSEPEFTEVSLIT